jgi:hypothetical protein
MATVTANSRWYCVLQVTHGNCDSELQFSDEMMRKQVNQNAEMINPTFSIITLSIATNQHDMLIERLLSQLREDYDIVSAALQCVRKVAVHLGYGTIDLVVSIEVAVAVCCCFTLFSC